VEDGVDMPLVSQLDLRNYLILTRRSDLDMSVSMTYEHYPLGTQEDAFTINLADEGIFGDFSTELILTPFLKCHLYDSAVYRTDYVDTRGVIDTYGGSRYEHFQNTVGANVDWLMAEDKNLAGSVSRRDVIPRDAEFDNQRLVTISESLAYEQQITPGWMAGVSAGFSQNTYPAASNRPDSASAAYSVFTSARLTDFSTGNASLGYSLGSVDGEENLGNMIGALSLETRLSETMSHGINFSRSQRAGFNSAFEVYDSYGYHWNWKGDLNSAGLFSQYGTVDPGSEQEGVNGYSDWTTGANFSLPFYVGWAMTDYITLNLSGTYSVRINDAGLAADADEVEWNEDYSTWVGRVGTSFPFFFRDLAFSAFYEHMERMSDSDLLPYTRDTVEGSLRYTHAF
jgi:hypothetical protein